VTTREPGQSHASASALDTYIQRSRETSDARVLVAQLQGELRRARATLKAAQAAEDDALHAYEATPYSDERAA